VSPIRPTIAVVVPVYNEEVVLPLLARRLRPVLEGMAEPYEVLVVDDGSTDSSSQVLTLTRTSWPELRIVRLRRNSGHQAALTAGLLRARGDYVVSMDADLQDPPEKIPEMLHLARQDGLDVVYGIRASRRSDSTFKRGTAGAYYRLIGRMLRQPVPPNAADFRLLSRAAIEVLRPIRGPVVLRLLLPWTGLPSGNVYYVREPRAAGRTKYPLGAMVALAVESVTSFSAAPLRIATWLGIGGMTAATALATMAAVRYVTGETVPGWASTFVVVLLFGALQLLCLGLVGEYIGRMFAAIQGRPSYLVASDTASDDVDAALVEDGPR
jgi:dolichol-phosphate mannosyltransferase